jgi:SPFH domain / Band 7 family
MAAKQVVDGMVGVLNAAWKIGAGVSVVALFASQTLYVVEPGHAALIFDRFKGVKENEYGAGLHFKVPFVQYPVMFDVRTQPRILRTETGTKDMQMVGLQVRVLYEPEQTKLSKIYQNIGLEYADQVLPSIGNEVMKAVVAEYEAHELVTVREEVSRVVCVSGVVFVSLAAFVLARARCHRLAAVVLVGARCVCLLLLLLWGAYSHTCVLYTSFSLCRLPKPLCPVFGCVRRSTTFGCVTSRL